MRKTCTWCSSGFEITAEDIESIGRFSPVIGGKSYPLPPPTLCPTCRHQRRLTFRNEHNFYQGTCAKTGRKMVSLYAPDSEYIVYDQRTWWSDAYDPLAYGRAFDPQQSFLAQWHALDRVTPKLSIQNAKSENCDYTNYSNENKDCYMLIDGGQSQDCHYSYRVAHSKNCMDCYDVLQCELCYESMEARNLYNARYSRQCSDCSDIVLCSFCQGCKDCFGCVNLRGKSHCIFNEQYEPEAYAAKKRELEADFDASAQKYQAFLLTQPHRCRTIINCEECSGDNLDGCKHCTNSFILKDCHDCRFVISGENDRTCMDADFPDNCELQYESCGLQLNYHAVVCCLVWYCREAFYSTSCFNSKNIFGCSGLKGQQYCILNKQYTEEEYNALVPKIIEKMTMDGEWGEFFPPSRSPFGYNETIAGDYFPLTKDEAMRRGFTWSDYKTPPPQVVKIVKATDLPDAIDDIPDDIVHWAVECSATKRPFKIIKQELDFYRQMRLPVPKFHPDERHRRRMALRNPRKLWSRTCAKCSVSIETSYAPERPEIVYCEDCYLKTVY